MTLTAHDRELVDAVALRMLELLDEREQVQQVGLVDASTLARVLGVRADYVYRHADELGAVRLGEGKRATLRFDVERAMSSRVSSSRSQPSDAPAGTGQPRRRRRRQPGSQAPLLPVRGL